APAAWLAFGPVRLELSWWLPSWVRIASGGTDRSQSRAAGAKAVSFDRNFDKCSLAGRQRATRPGDESVHSGAAGGRRRDACRCRGRRAGASAETLETW